MHALHYRNVILDFGDGILTGQEFRTKMTEVIHNVRTAEPEIRTASIRVLETYDSRDADTYGRAIREMHEACKRAGY